MDASGIGFEAERAWRAYFSATLRDLYEEVTPADEAGEWGRFRSEWMPGILAAHPLSPGAPPGVTEEVARDRMHETRVWLHVQKMAEAVSQPGSSTARSFSPGPGGRHKAWWHKSGTESGRPGGPDAN
jgi:hypothetical protein